MIPPPAKTESGNRLHQQRYQLSRARAVARRLLRTARTALCPNVMTLPRGQLDGPQESCSDQAAELLSGARMAPSQKELGCSILEPT